MSMLIDPTLVDPRPTKPSGPDDTAPAPARPLTIRPEWLTLTTVPCRACRGPLPTFVLDIPEPRPDFKGFDWTRAGAFARYSNVGQSPERVCRRCAFLAAVGRLCGGLQRERVASPELIELEKLRAELRALKGEPPPGPSPDAADDVLVDAGTIYMTPSVLDHARPRGSSPGQWRAFLNALVDRHRKGDFGLNGRLPIEVFGESRRLGPVASIEQQNGASFLDNAGSVRSEFPHRGGGDTIRIWSELGLNATLVYRPGDCVEVDT